MDPNPLTPWQRQILANALVALAIVFFISLIGGSIWAVVWLFSKLEMVLIPLVLAALLAYLQMPFVDWLQEKRGWSRSIAAPIVFTIGVVFVIGLGSLILPAFIQELTDLAQRMPGYFQKAVTRIGNLLEDVRRIDVPPAWQKTVDGLIANAMSSLPDLTKNLSNKLINLLSGAAGWVATVFGFLIVPVYVYYFLKEPEFFATQWKLYVPVTRGTVRDDIIGLVQEINEQVKAFFRGQCIVAACVGALAAAGFGIAGIDFALLLGAWVGVFDLVPFFGIIAGGVPATLIAYAQYGDWQHPLAAVGVCLVVHLIENLFLAPKIVGNKTGLHPVIIVLSILIWGKLLGFIGVLLAVPLTSTLKVLFRRYLWQRLPDNA